MGRHPTGERVLGPYLVRGGFQVTTIGADGRRRYRVFASEGDALEYKQAAEAVLVRAAKTIDEAIDSYEQHLTDEKGGKPESVAMTVYRLRLFCTGETGRALSAIPPGWGERRYLWLRGGTEIEPGYIPATTKTPLAVDTHRNILAEARSFFAWCVHKKWLRENPLAEVRGAGKRRHGKTQLRVDEARKWLAHALALANGGKSGAVAALMTLLMGMRASEVISRQVRDVDDKGRLLWIPDAKTDAGRRTLTVPKSLRPVLLKLVSDREADELLFGKHWRDWPRKWVQRICRQVGVPRVTAHGMRGLNATLGFLSDRSEDDIARALGHEDVATTKKSYAKREAVDRRRQERALRILERSKT